MLVEARRDERPRLPEHVRQRQQERRHQRDLERHEERAGDVGRDHRRALRQHAQQRRGERRVDVLRPRERGTAARRATATIARTSRVRSSIRCERKVSCGPSGCRLRIAHRQGAPSATVEARQRRLPRRVRAARVARQVLPAARPARRRRRRGVPLGRRGARARRRRASRPAAAALRLASTSRTLASTSFADGVHRRSGIRSPRSSLPPAASSGRRAASSRLMSAFTSAT